ncbi:hypothetical protein ACFE04_029935 [Oxalis oulophora]
MAASLLVPPQCSAKLSINSSTTYYRHHTFNAFFVTSPPSVLSLVANTKLHRRSRSSYIAMVQQQDAPTSNDKDSERLSARESLLTAFKDAGGFEALVRGKTTEAQKIDVTEKITALERLNPTPNPTTSPILEGQWNFTWVGSGTPGFVAARAIFERLPTFLADLSNMDIYIKDGFGDVTATTKLFNLIESSVTVRCKLAPMGPYRMEEEFLDIILESPKFAEATKPFRDAVAKGLTIPLGGNPKRFFSISYADDKVLILRDTSGIPEVLTKAG